MDTLFKFAAKSNLFYKSSDEKLIWLETGRALLERLKPVLVKSEKAEFTEMADFLVSFDNFFDTLSHYLNEIELNITSVYWGTSVLELQMIVKALTNSCTAYQDVYNGADLRLRYYASDKTGRTWPFFELLINQKETLIEVEYGTLISVEELSFIILEQSGGELALSVSPIQVAICPIRKEHLSHAEEIEIILNERNIRTILFMKGSLNSRIRHLSELKVPFIFIIGQEEINEKKVALRVFGIGDTGQITIDEFFKKIFQNKLN
ncbi:MAG: hypothetical protein HRT89_21535 [Lentisphaeria bacterium]|nr:His/Gly/Thr/Pro-type tRNA ligase C-terminal domain-containing protein [Lentisphaeria bacterium]NQZ70645.1 hypothetical protein [Lentisphaeria bacterium]